MQNKFSIPTLQKQLEVVGGTLVLDRQNYGDKWGAWLNQFWGGRAFGVHRMRAGAAQADRATFTGFTNLPGGASECPVQGSLQLDAFGRVDVTIQLTLDADTVELSRLLGVASGALLSALVSNGGQIRLSTVDYDPSGDGSGFGAAPDAYTYSRPGVQLPVGMPQLSLELDPAKKAGNAFAQVFKLAKRTFNGAFFYAGNSPCFFLNSDAEVALQFGDKALNLRAHVFSHTPDPEDTAPKASLGVSLELDLGGQSLLLIGRIPDSAGALRLHLYQRDVRLQGLAALGSLLQIPELDSQLPEPVRNQTDIGLQKFQLDLNPATLAIALAMIVLTVGVTALTFGSALSVLSGLILRIDLTAPFDAARRAFAAVLSGLMTALDVDIELTGSAPDFTMAGRLAEGEKIPVSAVLREVVEPLGLPWPKGIPQVDMTTLELSISPKSGDLSALFGAEVSAKHGIGGVDFSLQDLHLHFKRESGVMALEFGTRASLLGIEAEVLAQSPSDDRGWLFSGSFQLAKPLGLKFLFDQILKYGIEVNNKYVEFEVDHGNLVFGLGGPYFYIDFGISAGFTFGEVGQLNAEFALFEFAGAGPGAPSDWRYGLKGGLQLPNLPVLGGFLQFTKEKSSLSLDFIPDENSSKIALDLPLPSAAKDNPQIVLALPILSLTRDTKGIWNSTNNIVVEFRHIPSTVRPIIAERYEMDFTISSTGKVELAASPFLELYAHKLPEIPLPGKSVSLGVLAVGVPKLSVLVERDIWLSARIALGIPSEVNHVFGTKNGKPRLELFRVFDPKNPEETTVNLELRGGPDGVFVQLLNSPLKAVETEEVNGKTYWNVDMGEIGAGRLQLPVFQYDPARQVFAASGGFEITRELQLPLDLLQNLFRSIGLDGVADLIPDAIPLMSFDLLDKDDNLDPQKLNAFFHNRLPQPMLDALGVVASYFNETPDRFRKFMRFKMPDALAFEAEFGATGTMGFKLESSPGVKYIAVGAGTPVPIPALQLVELRSIAFHEMLSGQLIGLSVDATIDKYDPVTLAASVVLGKGNSVLDKINLDFLPKAKALRQTIELGELFSIIPYQSGLPIPIPVFFDRLRFDYAGVEGANLASEFRFPRPSLNLAFLAGLLTDFIAFFTVDGALLDPNKDPKGTDLSYTIGANYLTLPKYLGGKDIGSTQDIVTISLYENVAHLLNWLKTFSIIHEFVYVFPPEFRIQNNTFKTKFINLDLELSGGWVVSTPEEFPTIPESKLPIPPQERSALLSVLPEIMPGMQGVIVMLRGKTQIGPASLESQFAMLGTFERGFGTGFRLRGAISDIIGMDMRGSIEIDPLNLHFGLKGEILFQLVGTPIVQGSVSISEQGIAVTAALNLFPEANTIAHVGGAVKGVLSSAGFELSCSNGHIEVGGVQIISGAGGGISDKGVWLQGTFLGQTVRFATLVSAKTFTIEGSLQIHINTSIDLEVQTKVSKVVDDILEEVIEWVTKTFSVEMDVTLFASIGIGGFHGKVVLDIKKPVVVKKEFTISVTPKNLADFKQVVIDYVEDQKDELFRELKFI